MPCTAASQLSRPVPLRQSYVFPLGADISCLEYG